MVHPNRSMLCLLFWLMRVCKNIPDQKKVSTPVFSINALTRPQHESIRTDTHA